MAAQLASSADAARSFEPLTDADLARLAEIAERDRDDRFRRRPRWAGFRERVICVALCQGAALHYLDGRNGVKDFDVWTFYTVHPEGPFPARWRTNADFGPSRFGRHPDDVGYAGRRVDLIGRSVSGSASDPLGALRSYLRAGTTASARALAAKAVVLLEPARLRGTVAWPEELVSVRHKL